MKKILFALAATAGVFFASSCVKNADEPTVSGELVQVSFAVGFDNALATRAIADGTGADVLYYQAYDAATLKAVGEQGEAEIENKAAHVTLSLISGKTYKIAFWAQNSACTAYDVTDLAAVGVSYEGALNNDETRDAFCAATEFTVGENNPTQAIRLKRPFAQINVGAQEFADLGIAKSQMVVKANSIYSQYNILEGTASGVVATDVTFATADIIPESLIVGEEEYLYMSMSYVLVNTDLADLEFVFSDAAGKAVLTLTADNVSIEANHRTNLLGKVVNEEVELDIVIDEGMDGSSDEGDQDFQEAIPTASLSFPMTDANGYVPVAYGNGYEAVSEIPLQVDVLIALDAPAEEDIEFNVSVETTLEPKWQYDATATVSAGQTSVVVPLTIADRSQLTETTTSVAISTSSDKVQLGTASDYFWIANNFSIPLKLTAENYVCPFDASAYAEGQGVGALCDDNPGTILGTFYWDDEEAGEAFETYAEEIAVYGVYVDVTLPIQVPAVKFKYQNRNGLNGQPRGLKIGAEQNGEMTVIGTKTEGFNETNSAWNETGRLCAGGLANKFRFGVTHSQTQQPNVLTENPDGSMTLAELQVEIMY